MTNHVQENVIGKRIRDAYEKAGMSQREFAVEVLHCSQTSVSQKCAGIVAFNAEDIRRTAQFFRISADYFYGLTDYPAPINGSVVAA